MPLLLGSKPTSRGCHFFPNLSGEEANEAWVSISTKYLIFWILRSRGGISLYIASAVSNEKYKIRPCFKNVFLRRAPFLFHVFLKTFPNLGGEEANEGDEAGGRRGLVVLRVVDAPEQKKGGGQTRHKTDRKSMRGRGKREQRYVASAAAAADAPPPTRGVDRATTEGNAEKENTGDFDGSQAAVACSMAVLDWDCLSPTAGDARTTDNQDQRLGNKSVHHSS